MYLYLNHKRKNKQFLSFIFSMFYALMAYNISYYFNIMWLDVVYLTPLVLYGIDELIHENKGNFYLIFLSLAIFSNFYISYMLCIFCVIYFIYELVITYSIKDKAQILTAIKQFIIYSFLSALICSFILIPTIIDLQNIIRAPIGESMFAQKDIYSNFLMSLSKLFMLPQTPENLLSKYTPNIYFGVLTLLFSYIFFHGKSSNKEKYISIIIIIFFFLSFSTNCLNLLWHGFSYPNGYNYRYSFLFSFFMILIAFKAITNKDKLDIHNFLIFLFIICFIGFTQINDGTNIAFDYMNILLTLVFLLIYYIVIKFIYKKENSRLLKVIFLLLVIIELIINVNNSFYVTANLDYEADYNYYLDNICKLSDKYKNDNYRFDSPLVFGALESYSCRDNRIAGAITTNNGNIYRFLHNSGFNVTYSTVSNNDNTPIIYSLTGVNYYLNNHKEDYIKKINYMYEKNNVETFYLHNNEYALPLGFTINNKYKLLFENSNITNAFEYQNSLLKSMSGLDKDVLKSYDMEKIDNENYEVTIHNNNDIYIYLAYSMPENEEFFAEISINDDEPYVIDSNTTGVFKIKNEYDHEKIKVKLSVNKNKYDNINNILFFYYFDEDAFKQHINILKENTLHVNKKEKNYLDGSIEVGKDSILFLSIPYEKGWNIYIDGKKTNYYNLYDAFIGINLPKGKHNITMKFYSPGVLFRCILSIVRIVILVCINHFNKKNKK